jgi:hypothetical protein
MISTKTGTVKDVIINNADIGLMQDIVGYFLLDKTSGSPGVTGIENFRENLNVSLHKDMIKSQSGHYP